MTGSEKSKLPSLGESGFVDYTRAHTDQRPKNSKSYHGLHVTQRSKHNLRPKTLEQIKQ